MFVEDNFSITRLFIEKTIKITVREQKDTATIFKFNLILKPIKELYTNDDWNVSYQLITNSNLKKLFLLNNKDLKLTSLQVISLILCDLGQYNQFSSFALSLSKSLEEILPGFNIDYLNKQLKIEEYIITEEIWERIVYLLKLSCGEKVMPPLTFDSEEARKFYLAQKAAEERINRIRSQGKQDVDSLSKMMLSIIYAFPSITIDYLWNQTLAQIQWLQKYAAGAVSYEVNAKAFAAGNIKKGKKLDFFIK